MFPLSMTGQVIAKRSALASVDAIVSRICEDLRTQRINCEVRGRTIEFANPYVAVFPFARYTVVGRGSFEISTDCIRYFFSTSAFAALLTVLALIFAMLSLAVSRSWGTFFSLFLFVWMFLACAHYLTLFVRNRTFLQNLFNGDNRSR